MNIDLIIQIIIGLVAAFAVYNLIHYIFVTRPGRNGWHLPSGLPMKRLRLQLTNWLNRKPYRHLMKVISNPRISRKYGAGE